jgi:hypothetical protein
MPDPDQYLALSDGTRDLITAEGSEIVVMEAVDCAFRSARARVETGPLRRRFGPPA